MAKASSEKVGPVKKASIQKVGKPSSKPSTKSKVASKSEEFVVDSDDDLESGDSSEARKQQLSPVAASKPQTNGRSKTSAGTAVAAGKTKAKSVQEEAESESSSEESEDESTDDEKQAVSKAASSASKSIGRPNGAPAPPEENSSEEETSEEDSDDDENGRKATASTRKSKAGQSDLAVKYVINGPRPVKDFRPPQHFKPVPREDSSAATSQIESSLGMGRQIWHITAPRDVPLSSLKDLSLKAITNGTAILSHEGVDYGFQRQTQTPKSKQLLLASIDGYRASSAPILRQLHLRQTIKLDATAAIQSPTQSQASHKRKREQPQGLRQRFLPIGVVRPELARDHTESLEENLRTIPAEFKAPPTLVNGDENVTQKDKKKRKRDETEEERAARKAAKKAKKAAAIGDERGVTEATAKKKKKDKHAVKVG